MSKSSEDLKPFDVVVTVSFNPSPHEWVYGYDVTATGYSQIGDCRIAIKAAPQLSFTHASYLSNSFNVYVDMAQVAEEVSRVNKEKAK